uniref:NADH-ubiquinone oxidoreductase chain 4L n=1 Tax=Proasellus granadensis TaxID=1281974 RepID=A0A485M8T0_9CRUS|nr:NADH dehydrogenase subunit 4l [Proasellus granadensis]
MFTLFILLFLVGGFSFISNSKHLLAALISLEYMVLVLFAMMAIFYQSTMLSLAFLTIAVCEGALGLSVLVIFTQSYGSESLDNLTIGGW